MDYRRESRLDYPSAHHLRSVHDYIAHLLLHRCRGGVDVDVAIAGEMFEDRNRRVLNDRTNQTFPAAGDYQVDVFVLFEQVRDQGPVGGFDKLDGVFDCGL